MEEWPGWKKENVPQQKYIYKKKGEKRKERNKEKRKLRTDTGERN